MHFTFIHHFINLFLLFQLGFDPSFIIQIIHTIKDFIGIESHPTSGSENGPSWMTQHPLLAKYLTNALLAFAATKLFIPVKLGLTAYLTPIVGKKLRSMGYQLGQKGGWREGGKR